MARPLWKGSISFGLVTIPVHVYSATRARALRFRQLDRQDKSPIHEKRINETTGKEVLWEDIVKGYEYEKDSFVVLEPEDFERANVKATETIEIMQAVPRDALEPEYLETPHFIVPTKAGVKAYHLLRETLLRSDRLAIAQIVMRGHQHLAALIPHEDVMMLELLRFAFELKSVADLDLDYDISAPEVRPQEIEMAEQLVAALDAPWQPKEYRDEYRDDLLAFIERKAESGGTPVRSAGSKEHGEPAEVVDIMELLKQSVGEARKRGGTRRSSATRQGSGTRSGSGAHGGRGTRERRAS
jgi:DNA end-binding protein Ku